MLCVINTVALGDFQFHNECKVRSNSFMNFFIERTVEVADIEKYVFRFFRENLLFRCVNTALKPLILTFECCMNVMLDGLLS